MFWRDVCVCVPAARARVLGVTLGVGPGRSQGSPTITYGCVVVVVVVGRRGGGGSLGADPYLVNLESTTGGAGEGG